MKRMYLSVSLTLKVALLFCFIHSVAQNPIVPYIGMADPHIRIFNDTAWLYTSHDADSTAQVFTMKEWNIWSSVDLVNWHHERTINPTETFMGKSSSCWAPDAIYKNGFYYFYFSNGNKNTGVMKGKTPGGPFFDILNKPFLEENLTSTKEYDPSILIDDDKEETPYIIFGHHRSDDPELNYYIARLDQDMTSLAEQPGEIFIKGNLDVLKGNDKPTLHKNNGLYYLSAGSHYATSESIYGPYIRKGNSGNGKYGLTGRAHGNYFSWNNQWFHTWCHFHLGKEIARYRESYIGYLHYKDNGEMVDDTVFLNKHFHYGVGRYDASWDKIEAEWYMAAQNVKKKESVRGGFEISDIKNGSTLFYPNLTNLDKFKTISFYLSSTGKATIEVYDDKENGKLLGSCQLTATGSKNNYKKFSCKLNNLYGARNIYLKFSGIGQDLLHIDYFQFNK